MFIETSKKETIEIIPVTSRGLDKVLKTIPANEKKWLKANQFHAVSGEYCLIASPKGELMKVYVGVEGKIDEHAFATLSTKLPQGDYHVVGNCHLLNIVAWGKAQYVYDRYQEKKKSFANLSVKKRQLKEAKAMVDAIFLVRDLINTPCEDLGPAELAATCAQLALQFDGRFSEVVGEQLLTEGFPAIHTVGRASEKEPRLIELNWGDKKHPKVVLVGKGVCFDSGGLDIKPSSGMLLMKKDMGGSAHVIGLAQLIMSLKLPIQLTVLIPAVENAISGNAYRPGDVVNSRKGLTIEVGNTDAEGRVVLSDALAYGMEKKPDLIIDFATLTGAARVAVGTDIAAMFTNDDDLAIELMDSSEAMSDAVWRLPLHKPYKKLIKGDVADISNTGQGGYAGAITAALFLEHFVSDRVSWAHFDIMAWNLSSKPGKPKGGEALGLLACYQMLKTRYA